MLKSNNYFTSRLSNPADYPAVIKILENLDLPVGGVKDQFENFIILLKDESELIGCAGLEIYKSSGLVRSVAIVPAYQKKKLGSLLVQAVEAQAKTNNLKNLFLLTETAEKFFLKYGYTTISRSQVPTEIQGSFEYTVACKESAIVMKKDIL